MAVTFTLFFLITFAILVIAVTMSIPTVTDSLTNSPTRTSQKSPKVRHGISENSLEECFKWIDDIDAIFYEISASLGKQLENPELIDLRNPVTNSFHVSLNRARNIRNEIRDKSLNITELEQAKDNFFKEVRLSFTALKSLMEMKELGGYKLNAKDSDTLKEALGLYQELAQQSYLNHYEYNVSRNSLINHSKTLSFVDLDSVTDFPQS